MVLPSPSLPHRALREGRDYWIADDCLPDPDAVRARCLGRDDWVLGAPHAPQTWPGMRLPNALDSAEIGAVEAWVRAATGSSRLWVASPPGGARLDCNVAQLVGADESGPLPHTDSRRLCRYAAVLYLLPDAPPDAGTSFYRLRGDDGTLGGNHCPEPHANLVEALGVTHLPVSVWSEELRVENHYNRLLLYQGDIVHSATAYSGQARADKRMTIVFFWMAE